MEESTPREEPTPYGSGEMSLAFLHIPKSGGMTATAQMWKLGTIPPYHLYLREKCEPENGRNSLITYWYPGKEDLSEYTIVPGHGFLDTFIAAGADTFVTVLREPRSRLISSYFFLCTRRPKILQFLPPSVFDAHLYAHPTMSLLEYIRSTDKDANIMLNLFSPKEKQDVPAVLERMAMFDAIGFTESLDEFIRWLADHYHKELHQDRKVNVTRTRGEPILGGSVDEIISALNEKTAQDMEIYRWAIENRTEGFTAPSDLDETLERTMARFNIV